MKRFLSLAGILAVIGLTYGYYGALNKTVNGCIAGRGCCSSHGGVCGCKNGHTQCCDGTQSPTCQCYKDDIKGLEM